MNALIVLVVCFHKTKSNAFMSSARVSRLISLADIRESHLAALPELIHVKTRAIFNTRVCLFTIIAQIVRIKSEKSFCLFFFFR